jgi:flagellin
MSDLMRVCTNVQAMQARIALMRVNDEISSHQLRLATGKKINSAGEDPAGYALARSLESRKKGLSVALDNVCNARNVLNIAEGGYQNIMDILQTCKEKATQAADGSLSDVQRESLNEQVQALILEVDEIANGTTFNDYSLIGSTPENLTFHIGEGASDSLPVALESGDSVSLGISTVDLSGADSAAIAISTISDAIDVLSGSIQKVGQFKARLDTKESNLSVAITNTEAVRSKIEDADFAKEQMEVVKLQILQQTAVASLVQANSAPQVVLSLFR